MTRFSVQLDQLAAVDARIACYEFDSGNECGEHWLHLHYPYQANGNASIHERTVAACLREVRSITTKGI